MQAPRERLSLFLRGGADDHVTEAADHAIALLLELVRQLARLVVRRPLDANLPGRVPVLHLFLLPGLVGRLVRPALLVVQPALGLGDLALGYGLTMTWVGALKSSGSPASGALL